ncbi:hypothetical protein [Sanguibacter suaedae]|uniref:Uncharacterized protein n=1 Tax=Sanguibacter suaedae TaxID=2795737 RepID=A0A934I5E8_9MICO|nr:hypothetical protein [Sanguibacter suaedae]MBI9115924.1 hypothetical protein [Sanguibacter suaedae]
MNTQHDEGPTPEQTADLVAWAEAGDFHDVEASPALTGDEARAAGRAMLEAAGLDVEEYLSRYAAK